MIQSLIHILNTEFLDNRFDLMKIGKIQHFGDIVFREPPFEVLSFDSFLLGIGHLIGEVNLVAGPFHEDFDIGSILRWIA